LSFKLLCITVFTDGQISGLFGGLSVGYLYALCLFGKKTRCRLNTQYLEYKHHVIVILTIEKYGAMAAAQWRLDFRWVGVNLCMVLTKKIY